MNWFVKIIASIPIILVALYFFPFLGVCFLILRFLISDVEKKKRLVLVFFALGMIILIPLILDKVLQFLKLKNDSIPFLREIVGAEIYKINFIKYSKRLMIIAVILVIITVVTNIVGRKIGLSIGNYFRRQEELEKEYSKENDLKMKIKREKAKSTSFVRCPYCGADNIITEKIGVCQYCRRKIVNKNFK